MRSKIWRYTTQRKDSKNITKIKEIKIKIENLKWL